MAAASRTTTSCSTRDAARRFRRSRCRSPSARAPTRSTLTRAVERKVETTRGYLLPRDLNVSVTRNYGETAAQKSNELLWHMFLAVVSVSALIWLVLGRRESAVVLTAIPVTLALTLFVFYLYGYTLNRITLFALIFSIGILVDDAIVVVENIVRHARMSRDGRTLEAIAVRAVDEVGNPDDSRDADRDRRDPADGVRRRPDGPVHAPDSRSARRPRWCSRSSSRSS